MALPTNNIGTDRAYRQYREGVKNGTIKPGKESGGILGFIDRPFSSTAEVVGDVIGEVTGRNASRDAAKAERAAADKAQSSQERMFNQSLETQKPWLEAGGRGLSQLEAGINSGAFETQAGEYTAPEYQGPAAFQDMTFDFEADPGYQFRLSEGNKAVQASAAARGGLFSGKTGTDLQDYSQGLASQEYGNAYGRFQDQRNYARGNYESDRAFGRGNFENDRNFGYGQFGDQFNRDRAVKTDKYNRLASLAGVGQMTAGNVAGQQMEQGGNLANLDLQRGNIAAQRSQAGYQGGINLLNTGLQAGSLVLGALGGKK